MKRNIVRARGMMLGVILAFCLSQNVYAQSVESEETVEEVVEEISSDDVSSKAAGDNVSAKNGIVQVNTVLVDSEGASHVICGGTGFIIGDEEKNQYVITCNHIVNVPDEYKAAALTSLGVPNENDSWNRISFSTKIVVEGDVVLDASCLNSSEELDIAVLKLSQPIFTRTPLTILTAKDYDVNALPYEVGESVFALGYPGSNSYDMEPVFYSDAQISMTVGSIVNLLSVNNVQTIEHTAQIGQNNCGGPLVTEDGYVIGVNTLDTDGVYYLAVDSTKLTKILDGLGVEYSKEVARPVEEPVVAENTDNEVQQGNNKTVLVIIVCVVVVLAIAGGVVTAVILIKKKDKDEEKASKGEKKKEAMQPNTSAIAQYLEDAKKNQPVVNQVNCVNQGSPSETMVLGGSRGGFETSVLSMEKTTSGQLKLGTLIRRKSGEQIPLNKSYFTIGKDSLHVDYCIKDNGTISRQHAIIRVDEKGVVLEDCNSTNGTFLNGTKLSGGQAVILRSGDSVRLANEEFEYQAK